LRFARPTDFVCHLPQSVGIARHKGDVAALTCELIGNGASDPQAGAGDKRALALKLQVHVNSPA
jgi:hypothetical protein